MASLYIQQQAQKHNKSEEELEVKWNEAKKIAAKSGKKDNDFAYITSVFQKLINERTERAIIDQVTFKHFLIDNVEDLENKC